MYVGLFSSRVFYLLRHFSCYNKSRWEIFRSEDSRARFPIPNNSNLSIINNGAPPTYSPNKTFDVYYIRRSSIVNGENIEWPQGIGLWISDNTCANRENEIQETIDEYNDHLANIKYNRIQQIIKD